MSSSEDRRLCETRLLGRIEDGRSWYNRQIEDEKSGSSCSYGAQTIERDVVGNGRVSEAMRLSIDFSFAFVASCLPCMCQST